MRLFTALWPSEEAARHLAEAVDRVRSTPELAEATGGTRGFRFVPPQRWHLTLCFHGDDADQQWLSDRLDRRLTRLGRQDAEFGPPRLRLASGGDGPGWSPMVEKGGLSDVLILCLGRGGPRWATAAGQPSTPGMATRSAPPGRAARTWCGSLRRGLCRSRRERGC